MEFIQQNILWIAIAVVSGSLLLWPLLTGAADQSLSPSAATLKINREDAIVLDVRETAEWKSGHIAGARHITLGVLGQRLSEIEKFKTRPVIVCCGHGHRSSGAVATLKKAGFEQVFNLGGGITAWAEANLPLTTKD